MISLIIPMYNNEDTIEKTLEYVIKQTKSFYEVIIVDNGSTDKSAAIVRAQMKKNTSMKYIYCSQRGVSAARNMGVEAAKSKYVAFLDADDFLKCNYVEILTDFIRRHADADMYHFNFYQQFKNGIIKINPYFLNDKLLYNGQTFMEQTLKRFSFEAKHMVWTFVFKKAFLNENKLRFNTDVQIFEDVLFLQEAWNKAHKIRVLDEQLVTYTYNEKSATTTNRQFYEIFEKVNTFRVSQKIVDKYFQMLSSRMLDNKQFCKLWFSESAKVLGSIKFVTYKLCYFILRIKRKLMFK